MKERVWFTWESQRRNRTLSAELAAHLYQFDDPGPRLWRWCKAAAGTLLVLAKERPSIVFAQNPSLLLSLLAVWHGRLTGRLTVIDAHNAGIFPFTGRAGAANRMLRPTLQYLASYAMRHADITLVSNPALAAYVDAAGGSGFALPDPLPRFMPAAAASHIDDDIRVLFICTWAADEPYLEVIQAAQAIDPRIRIQITGNSKRRELAFGSALPANVELVGFVPEDEFVDLLYGADVIMDLTTLENCLVCGAYEAVAVEKPMVLSDTAALRDYFHQGAVFTGSDAGSIAVAIEQAVATREQLQEQVVELKRELATTWQVQHDALERLLSDSLWRSGRAARSKSP